MEFVYEDPSDEQDIYEITAPSDSVSHFPAVSGGRYETVESPHGGYRPPVVPQTIEESSRVAPLTPGSLEPTPDGDLQRSPLTSTSELSTRVREWPAGNVYGSIEGRQQDVTSPSAFRNSFSSSVPPALSERTPGSTSGERLWPLADKDEALLLRHFVAKLSLWVYLSFLIAHSRV